MQCPLHNQKVNKPGFPCCPKYLVDPRVEDPSTPRAPRLVTGGFIDLVSMVPHVNWHHPTSEHTKYRIYQQQCTQVTGSKCSLWGMKMTTTTKLAEFSFLSPVCLLMSLNAEVFVVVVIVGCVQGSWSQVSTFCCYSHCLPMTQNASKGYQNNFKTLRYNAD